MPLQPGLILDRNTTYQTSYRKIDGSNGALQSGAEILTITGSSIISTEMGGDDYAIAVWANGCNVVIEVGSFIPEFSPATDQYDLICASNDRNIIIRGGTFPSVKSPWTLNVKDSKQYTSHITVMDGKFFNFDPSNCNTVGEHTKQFTTVPSVPLTSLRTTTANSSWKARHNPVFCLRAIP